MCDADVNEVQLPLMVDTGSFDKYFLSEDLQIPSQEHKLLSFTQHAIKVVGYFECTVSYKDTAVISNVYVVETGTDVMGRDLIKALQFNIDGSTLSCNNVDYKDYT